jgi:hypothetical protein
LDGELRNDTGLAEAAGGGPEELRVNVPGTLSGLTIRSDDLNPGNSRSEAPLNMVILAVNVAREGTAYRRSHGPWDNLQKPSSRHGKTQEILQGDAGSASQTSH